MNTLVPFEIGIVAADIDAVLPFYTDVLGLEVLSDLCVPAATSRASGLAPDGYRVVRLETKGGDRLKLARPSGTPEAGVPSAYPMQRCGVSYVTFIVDDLRTLHDTLTSAGVPIRSDGIVSLRPGVSLLLATDPAGNWLEFVHYDDIRSYRPASRKGMKREDARAGREHGA